MDVHDVDDNQRRLIDFIHKVRHRSALKPRQRAVGALRRGELAATSTRTDMSS